MKRSRRNFVVFISLIGLLTLTSALLLALAPAPLTPGAANLFAVDSPDSMDAIFNTAVPSQPGRWKYIYIHHSATAGGNALTFAQKSGSAGDHFVIGNGDGAVDGEIQISPRWNRQSSALPPAGASQIDPNCVSICVVGDFDRTLPTPTQLRRLGELVNTLQAHSRIASNHVLLVEQPAMAAGIGQYFPASVFREQILP